MPPKTRFPENGSLLLIAQIEERNAELELAAVSGEDRCVTTLITAAKETTNFYEREQIGHGTPPDSCRDPTMEPQVDGQLFGVYLLIFNFKF